MSTNCSSARLIFSAVISGEPKAAVNNAGKDPARLERERALKDYVLLIPKSKLADTLKKRSELLETKKDEAKK